MAQPQSEATLLQRQQELLSRGKNIKPSEARELNSINETLREEFDYKRSEAPKYRYTDRGVKVKEGIGEVAGKYGYGVATPGSYKTAEEQQTGYRIEQNERTLREAVAQQNSLIAQQQQAQREQQRQEEARQQASLRLQGIEPVASSASGGTLYRDTRSGQTFSEKTEQVGSNLFRSTFTPTQQAQPVQKPKSEVAEFWSRRLAPAKEVGAKIVNKADDVARKLINTTPTALAGKAITGKTATEGAAYASERIFTENVGKKIQQNFVNHPFFKALSVTTRQQPQSSYTIQTLSKPVAGVSQSASNVAGTFTQFAVERPVTTVALTYGGPYALGRRGYALLDKIDVGQSVVTEGFKGFQAGGVPGAITGGLGGYAGERISDKIVTGNDVIQGRQFATTQKNYRPSFQITGFSTAARPTVVVSPSQVARSDMGQVVDANFDLTYQFKPRYARSVVRTKRGNVFVEQPLKIRVGESAFAPGVYYEGTVAGPSVVYQPARAWRQIGGRRVPLNQRESTRRLFSGSKRGQIDFTGGLGGTNEDFAGRFTPQNFQGTRSVITSEPTLKAAEAPKPKTFIKYPQSMLRVRTTTKSPTITTKMTQFKLKTFTGSEPQTTGASFAESFAKSFSQTLSPSISNTLSPSISLSVSGTTTATQTRTQSMTRTLSQTLSRTRTQTLSRTFTQTPTISVSLSKLAKPQGKAFKAFNTSKSGLKLKYTPTAFAAGFGIKGAKLKGRLSGLEFRGLTR